MPVFTRKRTGHEIGRSKDGKSARLEWSAYDPTFLDADTVLNHAEFPIAINGDWPDDVSLDLKCDQFAIKREGRSNMWTVSASWSTPPDGEKHTGGGVLPDPLAAPAEYQWSTISLTEAIDRDSGNNPILNSAGDGFEGGISRHFNAKQLTITKNQASFSVTTALAYENTVNSDSFHGASPQEVKCIEISPANVFTVDGRYYAVQYIFEFRSIDIWGEHPHQPRVRDEGFHGYASVDGSARKVRITDLEGESVASPVLLDGKGAPYVPGDYSYKVGGAVVAEPSWSPSKTVPSWVVSQDTGSAVFFIFKNVYPSKSFSGLGI